MKVPASARYDYCNKKACEFLEEYNINSFPIDVISIINRNQWGLTKYSELMEQFHCDRETVIHCLGSKDGCTVLDNTNYSIAYNDDEHFGNRIRFTLMHEIGHIYLNHLRDFEATKLLRGALTNTEDKVLENEVNSFARNVLVPTSMIQQLKDKSPKNISDTFGVSIPAARTRLKLFYADMEVNSSTGLIGRLKRIFYNYYYKKKCLTCGASLIQVKGEYCPICGKKTLKWGDGKMIYEEKIKVDSSSKAVKCPVCDNEQILENGEFCHICGTYLVNKCDNRYSCCDENPCGSLLPSNARYCHYCGHPSTFYADKLIGTWDKEYQLNSPLSDGFINIPTEVENEDLPFN